MTSIVCTGVKVGKSVKVTLGIVVSVLVSEGVWVAAVVWGEGGDGISLGVVIGVAVSVAVGSSGLSGGRAVRSVGGGS